MTIGLFGHTKLTDLAKVSIERVDPGYQFMTYVTQSHAKHEFEILNLSNLEKHGVNHFFIGSVGYKSYFLKYNLFDFLLGLQKEWKHKYPNSLVTYPTFMELIDHLAVIPEYKNWRRGAGNWIMENATVQPYTCIGDGNTLWPGSVLSHHSIMGSFNWLSPSAVVCGEAVIGTNNFIGANVTITNGVSIGNNNIICAGAVVSEKMCNNQLALPGLNRIQGVADMKKTWEKIL